MAGLLPKQKKQINLLQLLAIIALGFNIFTLVFIIYQGLLIRNITNRKAPTFIELINGKPATANNILERNPEAIRQFVSTTMIAIFNWSGNLPPQTIEDATNPKPDLGITVKTPQGYNKKITSSSWVASFALSEDFRQGFITQIADMTPNDIFISNNNNQKITGQLVIQRVYPPENIAPGKWRVGMVANIVQNSNNKKTITPFNKDFLVRAVDAYQHPLSQEITPLQQAVYKLRSQKLEIYEITDLCLNDTSSRCQAGFNTNQFIN